MSPPPRFGPAFAEYQAGRLEEALGLYEQALAEAPEDAELYAALGDCLHSLGRLGAAIEAYRWAVARAPDLTSAWWGLGCALLTRGEYVEAIGVLEHLVTRAPEVGGAWHNLGKARYALGLVDEARHAFLRAHAILGPNETTLGALATIVPGAHDADAA